MTPNTLMYSSALRDVMFHVFKDPPKSTSDDDDHDHDNVSSETPRYNNALFRVVRYGPWDPTTHPDDVLCISPDWKTIQPCSVHRDFLACYTGSKLIKRWIQTLSLLKTCSHTPEQYVSRVRASGVYLDHRCIHSDPLAPAYAALQFALQNRNLWKASVSSRTMSAWGPNPDARLGKSVDALSSPHDASGRLVYVDRMCSKRIT